MPTWDSTGEYKWLDYADPSVYDSSGSYVHPAKGMQEHIAATQNQWGPPTPTQQLAPHEYIRRLKQAGITDLPPGPSDMQQRMGMGMPEYFKEVNQWHAATGDAAPFSDPAEQERWAAEFAKPGKKKREKPSLAMQAVMEQFGGDMGAYDKWHGSKPPSLQKRIDSWPKALAQLKRERTSQPGGGGASWEEEFVGPPTELLGATPSSAAPAATPTAQLRGGRSPREVMDAHEAWVAAGRPDTPRGSPRSARETMDAYGQWAGGRMVGELPQGTIEGVPEMLQRPGFSPERSPRQVMDAYAEWAATQGGGTPGEGLPPLSGSRQARGLPPQVARPGEEGPQKWALGARRGMGPMDMGTMEGVPESLRRPGVLGGSRQARGLPPREVTPGPEGPQKWALGGRRDDFGREGMYTEGRFEFPQAPPEPGLLPLGQRDAPEPGLLPLVDEAAPTTTESPLSILQDPGAQQPIGQPPAHTGPAAGRFEFPQRTTMDFPEDVIMGGPQEARMDFSGMQAGIPPTLVGGARVAQEDVANALMGNYPTPMNFRGMEAGIPPTTVGPGSMQLPPVDLSQGAPPSTGPYGQLLGGVQGPGLGDIRFQEPQLQGPGLGDIRFQEPQMQGPGLGDIRFQQQIKRSPPPAQPLKRPAGYEEFMATRGTEERSPHRIPGGPEAELQRRFGEEDAFYGMGESYIGAPDDVTSIPLDTNSYLWQQYNTARMGLQAEDLPQRKVAPKTLSEINETSYGTPSGIARPLSPEEEWQQYNAQKARAMGESPAKHGFGPGFSGGPLQTLNQREMLRKRRANEKFSRIARGQ